MPPQPITRSGSGARSDSATTDSGRGHNRAAIHFHGAAGLQHPHIRPQPRRLRQPQSLGLQAGEAFAENPRGGRM